MTDERLHDDEGQTVSDTTSPKRNKRNPLARFVPQTPAEKRRLLVRTAIAAALLIGLVLVPGYLANRPSFVGRYERLHKNYSSWSGSVHAKVSCQKCHVRPGLASQGAFGAKMLGEYYLSLAMPSRSPKLFGKPTNAACSSCHLDLRTVSPKGDLNIPHRAHVTVLKLACTDCHNYLVHALSAEGKHSPPMGGCLKCHDGKRAKNACSACHTDKALPTTHKAAGWLVAHPQKAASGECDSCHKWTDRWCSTCHETRPRSHAADWRSKHGDHVKTRRNCEACHQPAFCVKCHGEVPKLNFDPSLKLVRR